MAKIAVIEDEQIEDEQILRDLMVEELRKHGHLVFAAGDGASGWGIIQEEKPEVVLLDLLMPIMSGYEVLRAVRAHPELKALPCIVISNSGQMDDLNRAYQDGANDVLIKANFNPEQLVEKIDALLSKGSVGS
jgi:CheY-like chemotaxis protein